MQGVDLGRILLSPFSLLYGMVVSARNMLYESGLLKSTSFSLPIISVGNLSVGGAGKTPHVEYLVKLLGPYLLLGILSRGYKRKTKGFRIVATNDNVLAVGDEPLQYKRKYPGLTVAVSESRALGIPQILKKHPYIRTILLDDAFQHRSVNPNVNILLTDYNHPYSRDFLLPAGRLREWRSSAERADIIIVSKCPFSSTDIDKTRIEDELNIGDHQQIFYTYYRYGQAYDLLNPKLRILPDNSRNVILLSAIANTKYLNQYLDSFNLRVKPMEYEDHHIYGKRDMENLVKVFENFGDPHDTIILTTEKDAMRLDMHRNYIIRQELPIFVLPIEVEFHFGEGSRFDDLIKSLLLDFKS